MKSSRWIGGGGNTSGSFLNSLFSWESNLFWVIRPVCAFLPSCFQFRHIYLFFTTKNGTDASCTKQQLSLFIKCWGWNACPLMNTDVFLGTSITCLMPAFDGKWNSNEWSEKKSFWKDGCLDGRVAN